MKIIGSILLLLFPLFAQASSGLQKFSRELILVNSRVLENKANVEKSDLDIELHRAAKNWAVFYDFEYDKNKLESPPTFSSNPATSFSHSLGVSKSWYHGGTLTFSNNLTTTEGKNFFSSFGEIHGLSQSLSYELDLGANFLGRNTSLEKEILVETTYMMNDLYSSVKEEELFTLAVNYTQAKLALAMERLDSEALVRAKKRERLIRKRVKDGLKLKVDLYQAEMSTKAQVEAVASSKVMKETALETLGKQLHRKVKQGEISRYNFTKTNAKIPQKKLSSRNKSLEVLKKKIDILNSSLKKNENSKWPDISLAATYISNDYDQNRSTALSDGLIGSDTNEIKVGVNLSWSLGNEPANLNEAKYRIDKNVLRKQKRNMEENISLTENLLKKKLKSLEKNIDSVKLRKKLARRALGEYNKLYNRGRADLDSVIRAEEGLINTEKAFANYLSERDRTRFQLAYLYGDITNYIMEK